MKLGIKGKIIFSIELSIVLITLSVLVVSYFVLVGVFRQQTYGLLGSVSILKENSTKQFLNESVSEIEFFVNRATVRSFLLPLLTKGDNADKRIIDSRVQDLLTYKKYFYHVMVLDKDGVIIYSSNPIDEGKIKVNEDYFVNAKEGTYIQSYYYDLSDQQTSMVVATPIKDSQGNFIGELAGQINVDNINHLIIERSGLGKTGETFLVNSFNLVTTDLLKQSGSAMKKTIYLPQINSCLEGKSANFNLSDYNGDMVFGYYHWFPEIKSCLITKIDTSEALAPGYKVLMTLLVVFLGVGMLMGSLGYFLASTVVAPIKRLHETMAKVREGDLDIQSDVMTGDEVGEMAKTFNDMTKELKISQTGLEEKVKEKTADLEEKVDELSKMNKLMIGRELRMIELKKQLETKENG